MRNFEFIPVLDLMGNTTVYAVRGERATYRPIETPLAEGSDPVAIAKALIAATGAKILYIADLDAIAGTGDNTPAIASLHAALPNISLWIDPGIRALEQCRAWLAAQTAHLVLGSETLPDAGILTALTAQEKSRCILSLDFDDTGFRGDEALLANHETWPGRVIVMTLAKVGSNAGPDMTRLAELISKSANASIYAAGGLRSVADANDLEAAGAAGVLLASALHTQRITQKEIAAFQKKAAIEP